MFRTMACGLLGVFAVSLGAYGLTGSGDSGTILLETVSPSLQSVSATTERSLSATFSEPMLAPGVRTPGNFAVSGIGMGTLGANPDTVSGAGPYALSWTAGEMRNGAGVTVTATGLQDLVGNVIDPAHNSASGMGLGVGPVFSNLLASPARAAVGDMVTISFTSSEPLDGDPVVTINGHSATWVSGSKGVDFAYSYMVQIGDPLGLAATSIAGSDLAGNPGSLNDNAALEIIETQAGLPIRAWPLIAGLALAALAVIAHRRRRGVLLLVAVLLASSPALAASPSVSNVTCTQGPNGTSGTKVDIYFDLVAPNGPCAILLSLSKNSGADGFVYPIAHYTGDIANVTTGAGKHIVWDIRADYPEEAIPQARIRVTADDAAVQHTLTYAAGSHGLISGTTPQRVNHGGSGTPVSAIPNIGYHFVQWSDASTQNPRTDINVTVDLSVTATFAINTYTITCTVVGNGTCAANPSTVNHGSMSDISVTPASGWHIVSVLDSVEGPKPGSYTTTPVIANRTVAATFAINTYTLTYTAGANGSISGTSPQTMDYGASGTQVNAVPDIGYHFVQWSDSSTQNPRTDTNVTASISVTAAFAINTYTLTYTAGANGSISGISPQTVDYGADGAQVTAVPNTGYHFVQWSDLHTENPRTDTGVTANINVTAAFAINQYNITCAVVGNGTCIADPATVNHGSTSSIVVTSAIGWHIVSVADSVEGSKAGSYSTTPVTASRTVTATFAINTYTITCSVVGSGTCAASPATVNHGSTSDITVSPAEGWHLVSVLDSVEGAKPGSYTTTPVTGNRTVTAAITIYTLTYIAGANGSISGMTPQTVSYGGSGTTVNAIPDSGYHFVQWSDASTQNPRTDINVTADLSVTATFEINTYTLTYAAGAGGSISGATPQIVAYDGFGTEVNAVPNAGYHFVQWSDASTQNPRTDTNVTANLSVTAAFAVTTYRITCNVTGTGTCVANPATVNQGSTSNITVTPAVGWHLVSVVDSVEGPKPGSYTTTSVTDNRTVTATFAINTYTLTYTAGANGSISGVSPQVVNYGDSGTAMTAVPNGGYAFNQWSDGVLIPTRTDTNVTGNISVTASFVNAAPAVSSFAINSGAATTMPLAVTLDNTATNSPSQYMASESASFTGASWQPYSTAPAFTLSFGVGLRTVYFKARNSVGESGVVSDTIFIVPNTLYVAAGTFTMGRTLSGDDATYGSVWEDPQHQVTLSAYQLGKGEVRNKEYCDVLNWARAQGYLKTSTGTAWPGTGDIYAGTTYLYQIVAFTQSDCNIQYSGGVFSSKTRVGLPGTTNYSLDTHPMVCVSWYGAAAFCNWLSQWQGRTPCYDMAASQWPLTVAPPTPGGYRLPTEAEWERAAAWDGNKHWIYGFTSDTLQSKKNRCNYFYNPAYINPLGLTTTPYTSPDTWFDGLNVSPNGSVATVNSVSPVGAYDMSGNVEEWCHDWYSATYYRESGLPNPTGPASGTERVYRGGSWRDTYYGCRTASRQGSMTYRNDIGFRLSTSLTTQCTLTYTAGASGAISGATPQVVAVGGSGTAVTAVPNTGYRFVQWSDGSPQNPRTDANVTTDISVTAVFAINSYALTYTAGANGSISGTSPQTVNYGGSGTTVYPVPETNYHFVRWSDGSTQNPRTDTNVTDDISVMAVFANQYTLTYAAGANGSITGASPQTVDPGGSGTAVIAVPNTGCHFVQWSDTSVQNPRTDTNVTAEISVTATFAINQYTLTYTAGANGTISGVTPQTVNYGGSGTAVTAVPNANHLFLQWSDGALTATRTDTNVTANVSAMADFVDPALVVTSFTINGGAATTATLAVTLENTATSGPTHYMASESASFTGASWLPYSTGPSFTLSFGVGPRTVYFKVRNGIGESCIFSDTIFLVPNTVSVAAGTFTMGRTASGDDAAYGSTDEDPRHQVMLAAYQIGKGEITNKEYCDVLNWALAQGYLKDSNGAAWTGTGDIYAGGAWTTRNRIVEITRTDCGIRYSGGVFSSKTRVGLPGTTGYSLDTHPMVDVSWYGAIAFCNWLSLWQGLTPCYSMASFDWPLTVAPPTAGGYRLPTEAEWERAAAWDGGKHWIYGFTSDTLAGTNNRCNYCNDPTYINPLGLTTMPYTSPNNWFDGVNVSPNGAVATVNSVSPVGAYDMSGNVWEWCQDGYDAYGSGAQINPIGTTRSDEVLRGGCWYGAFNYCRTACRTYTNPLAANYIRGFRLARTATTQYLLTYATDPNGTISGSTLQMVASGGSSAAVTAVPNTGYSFVQWSDASTQNPRTDTNVTVNISVTASFAAGPTVPVITSFAINGGAATTMPLAVTLDNTATNSPTEYMASESASFTGASWQPYSTAPAFTLSFGVGTRTVYFKVRTAAGAVSGAVTDTIFLVPNTVSVAAGTFTMGRTASGDDAEHGSTDEDPQHQVTLAIYRIGNGEVTNKEYCDVLNWARARGYLYRDTLGSLWDGISDIYAGPVGSATCKPIVVFSACNLQSSGGAFRSKTKVGLPGTTNYSMDMHPMVGVTWYGAVVFCNWLSEWQGLTPCYDMTHNYWPLTVPPPTAGGYRLPTEAEWERAAAWDPAAPGGPKHWIYGFTSDTLTGRDRVNYYQWNEIFPYYINPLGLTTTPYTSPDGWFNGVNVSPHGNLPTINSLSPVGAYDMSGNAQEWCQDWYSSTYYSGGPMTNPTGPSSGGVRVLRGGSWLTYYNHGCRSAYRDSYQDASSLNTMGFRVAKS